ERTEPAGSARPCRSPMRLRQRSGALNGTDGSTCLSVPSLEGLPDLAQRALLHGALGAVDVELAVEVAHLVLDEAGHEPLPRQLDVLALAVHADAAGVARAGAGVEGAGHVGAALVL